MSLQGLESLYRAQPVDPFSLVKEEIESVSERLRRSVFTGIPTLRSAAEYFFKVFLPSHVFYSMYVHDSVS